MRTFPELFLVAGGILFVASPVQAQSKVMKCDQSLRLADMQLIAPKGRLQDAGAPQTAHILELGKKAIPMLIACLTDETKTKKPIVDYWQVTTVGDISFFYLCDLFTDATWTHSTIDGVVNWNTVKAENPDSASWTAWYDFIEKHGRKYVQTSWSKKWTEEQLGISWDSKEQCYKFSTPARAPSKSEARKMSQTAPVAQEGQPHRIRVNEDVQKARLVHQISPLYPPLLGKRVDGTVVVHVIVGQNGSVNSARYISGPANLKDSAIKAVLQWRYKPTLVNGAAVEVDTTVSVVFPRPVINEPPTSNE